MKKFYFTFGSGQMHENGFVEIEAPTMAEAREKMNNAFGNKWSFAYSENEWIMERDGKKTSQEEFFGLHRVNI